MSRFKSIVVRASDSTVTVVVVNVLLAVAEVVALLVANPLPFMQPDTLPYWVAAQGILNIAIKYISKMSE